MRSNAYHRILLDLHVHVAHMGLSMLIRTLHIVAVMRFPRDQRAGWGAMLVHSHIMILVHA